MPKTRREVVELLRRGRDSLVLAVEIFNRPSDVARAHSVLILLHHVFEMLLKAAILRRTGNIHRGDGVRIIEEPFSGYDSGGIIRFVGLRMVPHLDDVCVRSY